MRERLRNRPGVWWEYVPEAEEWIMCTKDECAYMAIRKNGKKYECSDIWNNFENWDTMTQTTLDRAMAEAEDSFKAQVKEIIDFHTEILNAFD